ncbi:MAG: dihydropteroate synthase [Bacteroidia bacterium]|nr:dihydropteroate synthase [Bacteroidia bacterium]
MNTSSTFQINKTLLVKGQLISLSEPKVMGILNITPDSFFDGGKFVVESQVLKQIEKMLSEGATFIDIGGYSSRPGAKDISEEEEKGRVLPAIEAAIKRFSDCIISIDTFRSAIAKLAVEAGAGMINDISGGSLDKKMPEVVASLNVPYILMHMQGTPQTMTTMISYENLLKEMVDYFHQKIESLHALGIRDIIVDPGFGFSKTIVQNFELLRKLDYLKILEKPILVGLSRKSTIWKTLAITPEEALNGTTSLNTVALLKGASILRVHDVKEAMEVVKLVKALN